MTTENQTHIPVGWLDKKVSDLVLKIRSGGTPKSDNPAYYDGDIPFVSIEDMTSSYKFIDSTKKHITKAGLNNSSAWLIPQNSLLYSIYATLGVARINNIELATNQAILNLIPDTNIINLDFLYYLLSNSKEKMISYSVQTTQSNLNAKIVKDFQLLFPSKLEEQQKIASILSKLDEAITQTEQLIRKYKKIKEGLMHDLLTRGIDEHGNIRSEETHKFKDSPLGRIPEEWEVVDITKYTKNTDNAIKPGPFGSSIKKEFYTKNGYKVYGQEQVIANNPFVGDYYIDKKRYNFLYNFRVESEDVLLSCVGTIGNVLIIPDNYEAGIINPRLIKFSIDTAKTNVHFFAEYLKQSSINIQLINMANGGTMPVLNKSIILNLKFIYPSLKEQDRIQEKLDAISSHINLEIEALTKLQLQKSGLMHDLLTGKVRVKI